MNARVALSLGVIAPLALTGLFAITTWRTPLVLQNVTPSLPLGLYVRRLAPIGPGAVVALRQPAQSRSYLRGLGYPPGAVLLKRVAASGGEMACGQSQALVLDGGRSLPRRERDGVGRALVGWIGCRRLAADELIVVGDTPASFDSRYFRPVRHRDVLGVYERLR